MQTPLPLRQVPRLPFSGPRYSLNRARKLPKLYTARTSSLPKQDPEISFGQRTSSYKTLQSPFVKRTRRSHSPLLARGSRAFLETINSSKLTRVETANFNLPPIEAAKNPLFASSKRLVRRERPTFCKQHPRIGATSYCYQCKVELC